MNNFYKTSALEQYLEYVKPFRSKMMETELIYAHTDEIEIYGVDGIDIDIGRDGQTIFDYTFLRILNIKELQMESTALRTDVSITDSDAFIMSNFSTELDKIFWEYGFENIQEEGEIRIGLWEMVSSNYSPIWAKRFSNTDNGVRDTDFITITSEEITFGDITYPIDNSTETVITLGLDRSLGIEIVVNGSRVGTVSGISIPQRVTSYIQMNEQVGLTVSSRRPQYNITGMNRL